MPQDSNKTAVTPKVVVATTVALSFISFWRAAAIVLGDLASSMFYAGGIAEQAVGKSAPWFVFGVMLFAFAVRAVYMEGCGMFVRGGVYVVVRDSMGRFAARVSVSALIFDYLLTGPISSVSAGHYIGRLFNDLFKLAGQDVHFDSNVFAVAFAAAVTLFFWRANVRGIRESSQKALRIIQITTVMVVVLLVWCLVTVALREHVSLPPAPLPKNLKWGSHALGWFEGTMWPQLAGVAIIIAFGHAFLSLSGFETLAQVYRETAYPKLKNLRRTANTVCIYALLSTGLVTFFASVIIPDSERGRYYDNLIGGLSMHLEGPLALRLALHVFVVVVGAMILSAAVNTSMIGGNSVLNRVAEDGVLLPWFRRLHPRYGTTYRMVTMFAALQLVAILVSRGNVYLLGEAYAFGVVWSFFLKSLGVLCLRFQRRDQEYKVPLNLRCAGVEIPLGLILTALMLFLVAAANLISKQTATIYGLMFTTVFFAVFSVSEHINHRRRQKYPETLEEFNLNHQSEINLQTVDVRPGSTLVAVRDYNTMAHLQWVLDTTRVRQRDIVVLTVRPLTAGEGEYELSQEQCFAHYERELFSHVVAFAEKAGRAVDLMVVPAVSPFDAMVQTAAKLKSAFLVTGVSPRMSTDELARVIGLAWERMPEPRHSFSLVIVGRGQPPTYIHLGPHTPRLWPEDVGRVHQLWLDLCDREGLGAKLHHRDVVSLALHHLESDLKTDRRKNLVDFLRSHILRL